MYLSRIPIDLSDRRTVQAIAVPQLLHSAIEDCFPGDRNRNLWRIDTLHEKSYLLLVSPDQVDLSSVSERFGGKGLCETLVYTSFMQKLQEEQVWQFRLKANPTKSIYNPENPHQRGKVVAIKPGDEKQWLINKAQKHGFHVNDIDFEISEKTWMNFTKGKTKKKVTLYTVVYEGKLTITDPAAFADTLSSGIGRGKAYGCGLLTIAKNGGS